MRLGGDDPHRTEDACSGRASPEPPHHRSNDSPGASENASHAGLRPAPALRSRNIETGDTCVHSDCESIPSRAPSPWVEKWYEEDPTLSFREFGARIASEHGTTENSPSLADAEAITRKAKGDKGDGGAWSREERSVTCQKPNRQNSRQPPPGGEVYRRGDNDGNGADDDDDTPPDPKRRRITDPPDAMMTGEKFACPYQKRHPRENSLCGLPHGQRKYYGWDTVSRVKQHLLLSHGRDYHCSNCWKAFSSKRDAVNCRQNNCRQRAAPEKHWLTAEQSSRLREKIPNSWDGWYRIFDILFPDIAEEGTEHYRETYSPVYEFPQLNGSAAERGYDNDIIGGPDLLTNSSTIYYPHSYSAQKMLSKVFCPTRENLLRQDRPL
ncbi:uncharacterized protein DNG_04504 [Cephalotrichum gorgonifer]|uniref:C2H2-type domain-containing protein n=1 Tax=Cephalotrichum gorgonifer TaxID=2041049 RepID=A0AAE8SUM3_9PEZI|nr:uncharacterized protein DNG_04504 [Cephalotrichum gorgonifer]